MGDKLYLTMEDGNKATPSQEMTNNDSVPKGKIYILGNRPAWINDVLLLLPNYQEAQNNNEQIHPQDIFLITDQNQRAPANMICINGSAGKKTLWRSIISSGVLNGQIN